MGIQIETTIYGPQIMRALVDDCEEFAYGLAEVADHDTARLGQELADAIPYGDGPKVVAFLRALADAVEEA